MISNKGIEISDSIFVEKTTVESSTGDINLIEEYSFKKLVISNKILPQSCVFEYTTSKGCQDRVGIEVYLGEEDAINMEEKAHILLGKYTFSELPPEPIGDVIITIELSVPYEEVLSLKAQCNVNGIAPISRTIKMNEVLDDKENRVVFEAKGLG